MKIETFFFDQKKGWAEELPAELDSEKTLVIVFGATLYLQKLNPFNDLLNHFPKSKFIGCSTAGEIFGRTVSDGLLVGAVIRFDKTTLETSFAPIQSANESFQAGEEIACRLFRPDLQGILILSDGLNVNGSQLVAGLNSVLPPDVVATGGLAGDDDRFQKTWVLKNGVPTSNFVSAVGFYGENVKIRHGSKGGWDIFGHERKVTSAKDNELFEIDGKPALDLYKKYLGELASELPASALLFPLSLRLNQADEKRVVRTVLGVDEEKKSLTFAGDIPEGTLVQLMRANFDRLIDGAAETALMTEENSKNDVLSIAISCIGRRLILGERTDEELEAVMDSLPSKTKQIGFYSYGEISPYSIGHCDLHNQTMTLTTISEE